MKVILATTGFVLGAFLLPVTSFAADSDADRAHPMTFVQDSAITVKVKAKLADEKMASLVHIGVDTDAKGGVALSGRAKTQKDADKAVAIARNTEGVTSVTSTIQIRQDD